MLGKAVDAIAFGIDQAGLQKLVVLVVTHRKGGINRSGHEESDARSRSNPLKVKFLPGSHIMCHLSVAGPPFEDLGMTERKRVAAIAGNDDHRRIHRCLEDVVQRKTAVNDLHGFGQGQGRGL